MTWPGHFKTKLSLPGGYWLVTAAMALCLVIIAVYGWIVDDRSRTEAAAAEDLEFTIEHNQNSHQIAAWKKKKDEYIVFLPSFSSMQDVSLSPSVAGAVVIDAHLIHKNDNLGELEFDRQYDLVLRASKFQGTIEFKRSKNVPSIFISCKKEDFFSDDDKEREEKIVLSLFDEEGSRIGTELSAKIRGRGNSTWLADKKPYQIKLDKAASILGMASSKKWLLLANAYDATNLKNKIVLDLAAKLYKEWSPVGEFAEVYFNGAYNGLYYLTEKIEVKENRVPTDTDCLLTQETLKRDRDQEYITDKKVAMEIEYPEALSSVELFDLGRRIQAMEDSFFDEDDEYLSHIDLDSWVLRYLLDEFSGNYDANKISSYLYGRQQGDQYIFYGGPVWDYDKAFMQEPDGSPYLFAAAAEYRRRDVYTPYYKALLTKEDFKNRVEQLYKSKLRPKLANLRDGKFDKEEKKIRQASINNYIRWQPFVPPVGYTPDSYQDAIDGMSSYIDDRISQMDDKWLNGDKYYIVGIEPSVGGKIREYEVKEGEEFTLFPDAGYYGITDPVWYDRKSGEEYTQSFVPQGDIYLYLKDQDVGDVLTGSDSISEQELGGDE